MSENIVKQKMPRKKAEGEPKSVSFKSAKGDVTFTARSRKKLPDPEPVLEKEQDIEEVPETLKPRRQQNIPPAPVTPGLYDSLHEHLQTRSERHSQRWADFLIS